MRCRRPLALLAGALVVVACGKALPEAKQGRLAAGYATLYDRLEAFGCTACHTTGPQAIPNKFRLPPPGANDTGAVRQLWVRVYEADPPASRLVRKPSGELGHRGGLVVAGEQRQELIAALEEWLRG